MGDRASIGSFEWEAAFDEAGLDVEVPERSDAEVVVARGSVAQIVDDETGATAFVSLDEPRATDRGVGEAETERGAGAAAVNLGLRLGGARLLRVLGRKAGAAAARRWEAARRPEELRWMRPSDRGRDDEALMEVDDLAELATGPSLVWLHDALGRSASDFSGLDADLHGELVERYQGRVWAYDHPTLHLDPDDNAARLAEELAALGRPLEVDVVGFGRGGLVARALAARAGRGEVQVGSLVTVGTPHLGTPLASEQGVLAWVNRLTNLAVLAPDPVSDLVGAIAAVVAHAVEGTVDALPGFTAMGRGFGPPSQDPGTGSPAGPSRALFVGGAHHMDPGDGRWRAVQRWAANALLDDSENDLLVTQDSALGRRNGVAVMEGWPTDVCEVSSTHGAYFGHPDVQRALRAWLLDEPAASEAHPTRPGRDRPPVAADAEAVAPVRRETVVATRLPASARPGSNTGVKPLHVRLLHASLEHAQYPIVVGHFAGSPLSGAEERLDDCLENRLSRAQVARDYPEALGEFRHFPGYEGTPPPGAIVVGLGPVGDLTESQLTAVVTRSLVRYASEQRDRERASVSARPGEAGRGGEELGVASVLIGTSRSSGLSVESSVRAIVAGVVAANLRLQAASPAGDRADRPGAPVFTELRFVARHEDMVELAARALHQLRAEKNRRPGAYPIELHVQPKNGEGAVGPNPPDDTANDVWARLRIEASGPREDGLGELTYAVMARSARADEVTHVIDPNVVDDLIAKSINRRSDPRIGATLYELLVPHELKQPLGSGSHLHLLLDEQTADHPWELLTPRGDAFRDARPVALGGGLLRQFLETGERRRAPERAPERTALVIGNPPPGPGFPPLPGAAREAIEVRDAFIRAPSSPPWSVTARIWDGRGRYVDDTTAHGMADGVPVGAADPAEDILHELMTGSWRVVHIAAHGSFDPGGNAALSGVVLGTGRCLTAATIGQLDVVPDLVVLNACHLGAIHRQLAGMNRVAASLARRLMQIGVRAVIAAGWAVGDIAAAEFAKELYAALLAGRELGDAVLSARSHVHAYVPTHLTWGAYQCYGDPGFRLAPRRQQSATMGSGFLTVSELRRGIRAAAGAVSDRTSSLSALRRDIEEVTRLASEAAPDAVDLVGELEALESDELFVRAEADVQANIAADLAVAWAELGDFERAAGDYRFALENGGNDVPLVAVEQLVNLSVRMARRSDDPAEQQRLFAEARRLLRALDRLGPTAERMALWGSYYKKRACIAIPPDYGLVAQAARRYRRALELDGEHPKAYHELNARQLGAIVGLVEPHRTTTPAPLVRPLDPVEPGLSATFWGRSEVGDRLLTSLVEEVVAVAGAGRELGTRARVDELEEAYVTAFRLRSSAANRRSVIEHLEDIAILLPADLELQQELARAAAALREVWLPSATISPPSAAGDQPADDPGPPERR